VPIFNQLSALLARPVQYMLDRGVEHSTTAAALCRRLEGRSMAVVTGAADFDLYFTVADGKLICRSGRPAQADATLSGSPLNLARLAAADPEAVIRAGHVRISGDADIASDFRALLDIVRPDWEEELSRYAGDVVAHEVGRAVRGFGVWAARTRQSLGRSLAEYLTEESRDLAAAAEIQEFNREVDELAVAVDRCEARLRLLRAQHDRS
jgi:ubiquinone biosynthesis protein UbiJ